MHRRGWGLWTPGRLQRRSHGILHSGLRSRGQSHDWWWTWMRDKETKKVPAWYRFCFVFLPYRYFETCQRCNDIYSFAGYIISCQFTKQLQQQQQQQQQQENKKRKKKQKKKKNKKKEEEFFCLTKQTLRLTFWWDIANVFLCRFLTFWVTCFS